MARTSDQKRKLLLLIEFFKRKTDEEHTAQAADILAYLEANGVEAERKSIYSDINALQDAGFDIVLSKKGAGGGYFLASGDFELAELKLLVDAVQSAKFITQEKSGDIIKKIETLTSEYNGRKLQRQVYVTNRVKAQNDAVIVNVDNIHEAIQQNRIINFLYSSWNIKKELVPRHNGEKYVVTPIYLVWDDENYYMVGYDEKEEKIKHFRVDKISKITITEDRPDHTMPIDTNLDEYSKMHFGMFGGEGQSVTLKCENKLVGVIIDRFGRDVPLIPRDDEHFAARISVQVSDQFFGWLSGFRGGVTIDSPVDVKEKFEQFIEDIRKHI